MEPLNIIKYSRSGLGAGVVNSALHTFPFKQAEEAFHRRIVRTTADCTHTANEIMPLKKALVVSAGELTTPVRMHYDRRGALTLPQRHQDRLNDQFPCLTLAHGPTHDDIGIQILYGTEI